jgi:uncharacterized protein YaiL (DUF2058 family)
MKQLEPNLAEAGVIISREKAKKQRIIKISRIQTRFRKIGNVCFESK